MEIIFLLNRVFSLKLYLWLLIKQDPIVFRHAVSLRLNLRCYLANRCQCDIGVDQHHHDLSYIKLLIRFSFHASLNDICRAFVTANLAAVLVSSSNNCNIRFVKTLHVTMAKILTEYTLAPWELRISHALIYLHHLISP